MHVVNTHSHALRYTALHYSCSVLYVCMYVRTYVCMYVCRHTCQHPEDGEASSRRAASLSLSPLSLSLSVFVSVVVILFFFEAHSNVYVSHLDCDK